MYAYYINLDERGEFYADVRDENDNIIYEIKSDEETGEISIIKDGYMRHKRDCFGLTAYLKQLKIIGNTGIIVGML